MIEAVTERLGGIRAIAEQLMVDTCTVSIPGTPTWSDTTGTYTPGAPQTLYTGRCRVQVPESTPGAPVAGEAEWTVSVAVVSLPVVGSESVAVGANVHIDAATLDAALVGQDFKIVAIPLAKTHATARRLRCEAASR